MPSPEQWIAKLDADLERRRPRIELYEAYYDGQHRLAFSTSEWHKHFGDLFAQLADNWCDLVVDASVERLAVQGFRFGAQGERGEPAKADDEAWRIWQANGLDAESIIAFTTAVKAGEAYLLVSPNPNDEATPLITIEHPAEMIVAREPGFRRRRSAAWKKWLDDSGYLFGTLYLSDRVIRVQSKRAISNAPYDARKVVWESRSDAVGGEVRNPLGVVPVVALENNPGHRCGRSDIAGVIATQDAVNKLLADMIVAAEFAAFRQRWAAGIEIPIDPATGQPMDRERFLSSVSRMWTVPEPDTKFGEFAASDLSNYVRAIEMLVQHLAARTRTPPHYLLGQSGAFPSGESLKSTETGLVAKVRRKQTFFGEGLEETMRLAFRLKGDEARANAMDAETIWSDPESRTEGELVDALLKMATLGVPQEALWARWGATPVEIARWKAMQREEAMLSALFDPLAAASPNGQGLPPEPEPVPVAG